MIYLDHNSATYVLPHVYEQLSDEIFLGNADSQHAAGAASKKIIDGSREIVATLLGTRTNNVLFTSGATEANAMALSSYRKSGHTIWSSAVEHKSVLKYADEILPVTPEGYLCYDTLAKKISGCKHAPNIVLACMYANNETGIHLDPDCSIAELCRAKGIKLHIDASQCYAKGGSLSEIQRNCASTIVISGHKMHAMKGVGALAFKDNIFPQLYPLMLGGAQQWGLRPGTINTEAIYSLGLAVTEMSNLSPHISAQMQLQIAELERILGDVALVNGAGAKRLPNTTNLYFPKVKDVQLFVEQLSVAGVMVSGMSACESGMSTHSYTLAAMYGELSPRLSGSIRVSISPKTTWQEIIDAAEIIKGVVGAT
jgi:cysteine desulfurase